MSDRRVLTKPQNNTREAAERLFPGWKDEPDAKVELFKGEWAVTAAKTKKEDRA